MKVTDSLTTVLLVSSSTVLCSHIAASAPLSINQAIEKAISVSPERRALLAERESSLARSRRAFAPAEPTFDLGIGDLAATGQEASSIRTYQLTQSLRFPGKASAEARSFELDAKGIDFDVQAQDQNIAQTVKASYYELSLAKRKLELNELRRDSFEKILKIAKRRSVVNTTSEVEYLSVQTTLHSVDNEKADFLISEKRTRSKINLLLGQTPEAELEIEKPSLPSLPFKADIAKLRISLIGSNQTLKAGQAKTLASANRVTEAKRAFLPDFKFSAGINNFNNTAGTIELSVPIWFWWNEKQGIHEATQNQIAQEATVESERRRLLQILTEQASVLEALSEKLTNYQTNLIPISKRAFEVALANYKYGKIDFSTLTNATNAFVNSQVEYETLLTDFLTGRAALEKTVGGSL